MTGGAGILGSSGRCHVTVNVTLPKSARERMWQSWLDDERHRDGASAIHSAEETVGLLICSCLLNVVCRRQVADRDRDVSPLTAHAR